MPRRRDESLGLQHEKLLVEVLLDIRDLLEGLRGLTKRIKAKGFELVLVDKHEKTKQKKERLLTGQ